MMIMILLYVAPIVPKLEKKYIKKIYTSTPPPPPPKLVLLEKFILLLDSIDNECKLCSTKPLCKVMCKRYLKAKIQNRYGICKNCIINLY